MILIVADSKDAHARAVRARLRERGLSVERFDVARFKRSTARVSSSRSLEARLEGVDLAETSTVWLRRCGVVGSPSPFARQEATAYLASLALALRDRFWVNPLMSALANDRGNGKVSQLEVARGRGLAIPSTLVTNDPKEARAFVGSCSTGAVYKPLASARRPDGSAIYTTRLEPEHLNRLGRVRHAPCVFQELVPKRVDVRAIVLGWRVLATEIHSQEDERSAVDFRAHYDLGRTRYAAHSLPKDVEAALVGINADLGLVFAAHDLVQTPDGRYVWLEANQQGQWLWLEEQTGQPFLDAFCDMLEKGRA